MEIDTNLEVERKFLLKRLPSREIIGEGTRIRQFYLPGPHGEIRIREKGARRMLAAKDDGSLVRKEWEIEVPDWVASLFRERAAKCVLEKMRYVVRHDGHDLIVDEYAGTLSGLLILECEFESEAASHSLVLPDWAGGAIEVTSDRRYKNKALAQWGNPGRGNVSDVQAHQSDHWVSR